MYQTLQSARAAVLAGEQGLTQIEQNAMNTLSEHGWKPDYIAVRRQSDLLEPSSDEVSNGTPLVILTAARLGATRLIDNLEV